MDYLIDNFVRSAAFLIIFTFLIGIGVRWLR